MRKALVCLLLAGLLIMLMGAAPAARRGYVAGRFALELDGVLVGWVQSVEGGHAVADVVVEQLGGERVQRKHVAGVKYEDITITVGANMAPAFYQWLADTLEGKLTRKSGAIVAADYELREVQRMTFAGAIITEVGFPALDASSKDAAKLTVKFQPEVTRQLKGSGAQLKAPADMGRQKQWLPANFRLRIDGLDEASKWVNRIEAFTIKQKVVEHAVGEMRDYEIEPVSLEVPNLVITLPESHADAVAAWHEDFVIRGNNDDDKEKGGTLEFLSPDLKTVYFKLEFRNLGIFRLAPEKVEAGSENIRRVKAEMYCEDFRFSVGAAGGKQAAPATPAPAPVQEEEPASPAPPPVRSREPKPAPPAEGTAWVNLA